MPTKEQMLKARELIKAKRYDEARAILQKINHPKAKEWLAMIDKKSPASQSKRPAKSAKTTKHAKKSGGNLRLILMAGGIVTILALIVLFLAFSSRDDGDGDATPNETALTQPADEGDNDSVDNTAQTTDDENTDNDSDQRTVSDVTVRVPFVQSSYLVNIDIPAGWVCDCGGGSGNLETATTPRQRIDISIIFSGFDGSLSLEDVMLSEIDDDETATLVESLQSNGRDILFAIVVAEDGDSDHHYYVADSDGELFQFTISDRDEPETLRDIMLSIAGTVEAESGDSASQFTSAITNSTLAYNAELNLWRFADFLSSEREHTVELPPDWAIEANFIGIPMAVKSGDAETSATAFNYISSSYFEEGDTLSEIADLFIDDVNETIQSEGTETVNGREVYYYVAFDSEDNSSSASYYVLDSDGDLVVMIIQPNVPDKASLHQEVLQMAGSIEIEEVDYMTQLARAGLIDGDVPDDGFAPLSQ